MTVSGGISLCNVIILPVWSIWLDLLVRRKMFRQHIAHMCAESVPWLKEQKTLVLSTFLGDHQAV